jgi:hypothetical protein
VTAVVMACCRVLIILHHSTPSMASWHLKHGSAWVLPRAQIRARQMALMSIVLGQGKLRLIICTS